MFLPMYAMFRLLKSAVVFSVMFPFKESLPQGYTVPFMVMEQPVRVFNLDGRYELATLPPVSTQLLGEPLPIISDSAWVSAAVFVAGFQLEAVK